MQLHAVDITIILAYMVVTSFYVVFGGMFGVLVVTSVLLKKSWYDKPESE